MKNSYRQPTDNITSFGEKLAALLRGRMLCHVNGVHTSIPTHYHIGDSSQCNRAKRGNQSYRNGEAWTKPFFTAVLMVCTGIPKNTRQSF